MGFNVRPKAHFFSITLLSFTAAIPCDLKEIRVTLLVGKLDSGAKSVRARFVNKTFDVFLEVYGEY